MSASKRSVSVGRAKRHSATKRAKTVKCPRGCGRVFKPGYGFLVEVKGKLVKCCWLCRQEDIHGVKSYKQLLKPTRKPNWYVKYSKLRRLEQAKDNAA